MWVPHTAEYDKAYPYDDRSIENGATRELVEMALVLDDPSENTCFPLAPNAQLPANRGSIDGEAYPDYAHLLYLRLSLGRCRTCATLLFSNPLYLEG